MRLKMRCVLLLLVLGCTPIEPPKPPPVPDPPTLPPADPTIIELLDLHNRAREAAGLPRLVWNSRVQKAAQGHAAWMAATNTMSHTGQGGSSFWDRLQQTGYRGNGGGENIAAGYRTPKAVFDGWLRSAGHKRNIMDPRWEHVGLGWDTGLNGRLYWCVVFAKGGAAAQDMVIETWEPPPLIAPKDADDDST